MKFENTFAVDAPVDEVFKAILDVERVTPCMPGAEVLERIDDDAYKVGIRVKLGPISMLYRGQVEIVERDEGAHTATMRAKAKEARGQGTADAHVHMSMTERGDGTQATMATELRLSGRAAAMGQGVIADVSARLVETFAGNLAQMLEPGGAQPEVNGSSPDVAADPVPDAAPPAPSPPAPPKAPPPPAAAAPASDSLPIGKIAAGVISGRLSNPKTLVLATASLAGVSVALGYVLGRRSG